VVRSFIVSRGFLYGFVRGRLGLAGRRKPKIRREQLPFRRHGFAERNRPVPFSSLPAGITEQLSSLRHFQQGPLREPFFNPTRDSPLFLLRITGSSIAAALGRPKALNGLGRFVYCLRVVRPRPPNRKYRFRRPRF